MQNKSAYLISCLLLCLCSSSFSNSNSYYPFPSPPINDICSGAIDFGVLECNFYEQFDEDPEATPDPEATGNCIDNTQPAQWYTFTTPNPLPYNSIYTASSWIDFEIFSTTSDCSALVYVGCGTGPFAFEPEPGTKYYYLTTGGFHMTLFFAGLSTCSDPLVDFESCNGPIHSGSYTDCAWSNDMVVCQNDHVIWFDYTAGNSGGDVVISVDEFSGSYGNTADDVSISVFSDDCSTLLYGFDPSGFGYVCSALVGGQSLTLEDLPPGYHIKIAIGSALNETGHFDLFIEAEDEEEVSNDLCQDAEILFEGTTPFLSNVCSNVDVFITECVPQSEATVWYEFDPGSIPQDIEITLHSTGISSPAIAVYDGCQGYLLESVCGNSLELFCIDHPIFIQIGSEDEDVGTFDLEIETNPSLSALEPIVTAAPICSNSPASIFISIPNGEIVNIFVEISTESSNFITGMNAQSFFGVNSALIKDTLINSSSGPEEAIYTITIETFDDNCPTVPVEFPILVYPEFKITEITIEECAPFLLELDAFDIIEGGTIPYLGILWYWNSSGLIGTSNVLSMELIQSGEITLKVIDFVGCRQEVKIDVDMSIRIDPTFDIDSSYCRTGQDSISFPKTSLEGIEGVWSPAFIDLAVNIEDIFYEIQFIPDEKYCSNPVTDSILIYSGDVPEFDLPEILCAIDNLYTFPSVDLNGILGSWEVTTLDLSNFEGVFTNTFSHNHQDCYASFEYQFMVEPNIELSFGQPDSLCRSDEPVLLNNLSANGYEGNWNVPIVDPSIVSGNTFISTWTPNEGQSICLKDTSITIYITDPKTPEFDLPDRLCALETTFTFPTIDNFSISGSWNIPVIDPTETTGFIQSVFTADDACVETFTWEVEIVAPLSPEFSFDLELCSLDDIYTLPMISDNGIPGQWSPATIDPSVTAGEQVMISFQVDPTEFCVISTTVIFDVIQAENPIFDLPIRLCWEDEDLVLPTTSNNEIEGNWSTPIIDIESNLGTTISSTFTPTDGSCSNAKVETFEIIAPYLVDPIGTDPSDCTLADGSIQIDVIQGTNLEFSIDGGTSWQSTNLFSSLSSGAYTILIRSADLTACMLSMDAFLSTPDGPIINDVSSINISSCITNNGSIIVDAEGDSLEYSIDDGATWQASNEFNNLPEGSYVISIREVMSDCIVESSATIIDFPQTEIILVNTQDLSDCNIADGQIEIEAIGESLEYSIDNGLSWSAENVFDNLSDGEFIILVQSTTGDNCFASATVNLIAPSAPNIINLDVQNPTFCIPSSGSIEVEANGSNLEYSIDGGITWQNSNFFFDLSSDEYQIIVRDKDRINCFEEELVMILLEDDGLPESTIIVTPPSECDFKDASLEVMNVTMDVEYSVDGGLTWQQENIFNNLTAGTYILITRKIFLPDCLIIQTIEIPNTACPCKDLFLAFMTSNMTCTGEDSAMVELITVQGMTDPNILIQWQNGETGLVIEGVVEGWQLITIAYDDGCIWADSVWVELINPVQFDLYVQDLECPEINNGAIEIVNTTGGSGDYQYSLDGIVFQAENLFSGLPIGAYEVYVKDETNCLTINNVEIFSNDKIEIDLPEIEIITIGQSIILDPNVDADRIDNFNWTPREGILNPNNLVITVAPIGTTTYTLEIFYGACWDSKEITIEVYLEEEVFLGNVFSPNDDNHNDELYLQGKPNSTIELNNFTIYDRWGNKFFTKEHPEFNNKADGWDGYYQGALATSGVYVYIVNYTQFGQQRVKIGTVTLIY